VTEAEIGVMQAWIQHDVFYSTARNAAIPMLLPNDFSLASPSTLAYARRKFGLDSSQMKNLTVDCARDLLQRMFPAMQRTEGKYYNGALYSLIPRTGCHILSRRSTDRPVKICVSHEDGRKSEIRFESVAYNTGLLDALVSLIDALPTQGNARRQRLDAGHMHALGYRSSTGRQYAPTRNPDIKLKVKTFATLAALQLRVSMPDVHAEIRANTSIRDLDDMGGSIAASATIYPTLNFENSAHFDPRDKSKTWAVWANPASDANNWFFVFPDLSINNSQGVAFKLFHGASMAWDGRIHRHCTSVAEGNQRYSCGLVA
jgi:hypothetical protein